MTRLQWVSIILALVLLALGLAPVLRYWSLHGYIVQYGGFLWYPFIVFISLGAIFVFIAFYKGE